MRNDPARRGMMRRIGEVTGALIILAQQLIVELKERVQSILRMFMTRGVGGSQERGGRGRDVLPTVKGTLTPSWPHSKNENEKCDV